MRTASRVFFSIGLFGLVADLMFAAAGHFRYRNIQGPLILTFFFLACMFLAVLLGKQGEVDLDGLVLPGAGAHDDHDEEIHLPGPSWYPAFYGVACLLTVLGLVFDLRLLAAGIVALVLTTIGWGVESVHEYRREIAHAKPVEMPPTAAIGLAHELVAFRRTHGGADAVVQHLGRGRAEIVAVGGDGTWWTVIARDVATARAACRLAGTTLHDTWPGELSRKVRNGEQTWRQMGGESALSPVGHHAPRDGATQTAATVFLSLAIFAFCADLLYGLASKFHRGNVEALAILTAFGLACFYLYLGLKAAKAQPADAAFADEANVTIEPSEPDPPVDLETLHLPGPSWWPAFFSVALGLLVWGLVYSPGVLVAGIALTVLCCVGWGVESVHEYRQSIAGHH